MLCDYGCGQEAKFQMKNGKWCCNMLYNYCMKFREKLRISNTGRKHSNSILFENKDHTLCSYCLNEAQYRFKNGKYCCKKSKNQCETIKRKNSKSLKNSKKFLESRKIVSQKTKGLKRTDEFKKLIGKFRKGKKSSEETKRKIREKSKGRIFSTQSREKQRQYMLNGGATKALKGMKKISKEELKLREMVKEIYPNCEFQHPVFNYSLDVAIPEHKIAIEFDGYFHFDKPEHIEYFKQRQTKIEAEGWKFYRVTMFDKFPNQEEIKNNIQRLIC